MGFTVTGSQQALDNLTDQPLSIALSSTDPETDGVTEPSGNGYARVDVSAGDWSAATSADPSVKSNAVDISFPQATGDWIEVGYFAAFDANGDALLGGQIVGPNSGAPITKSLSDGDTFTAAAGQLKITLT